MNTQTSQNSGSDLYHDGCRKLSVRLGFVKLFQLGAELLANYRQNAKFNMTLNSHELGSPRLTSGHCNMQTTFVA